MVLKQWQTEHFQVISEFLAQLNDSTSDFVLKGGNILNDVL